MPSRTLRTGALVLGGLVLSTTVAVALPWDVDMADSQAVKAYRNVDMYRPGVEGMEMGPSGDPIFRALPEGVVSQPNVLTPNSFAPNYERGTPEGEALTAPFPATEARLATGEHMYNVYCTPCHGDGVNLGPVAAPGRYPGVVALGGKAGVLKNRTDGWVYLTVRNGGAVMQPYGWAMTDEEMWSLVQYTRTLPQSEYVPPPPPAAETEGEEAN